ncbi:MAG: DUF2291 family protein, partial [Janthinobacterium lividum]
MVHSMLAARSLLAFSGVVLSLSACHVVSEQELADIHSQGQHRGPDATKIFTEQLVPYADKNAKPAAEVIGAVSENFDNACKQYGFRQTSAFPCNFWLRVQGRVTRIDHASRVGKTYVELTPSPGSEPLRIVLETGPVVVGTGVRDAFPGIKYGDFNDQ